MPNKYYSPYDFLTELQAAVRKKYDIDIVEVRYIVSIVRSTQARARDRRTWRTFSPSPASTVSTNTTICSVVKSPSSRI